MTIKIDQGLFLMRFAQDGGFHAEGESTDTYLDRSDGSFMEVLVDLVGARANYGDRAVEDFLENAELLERDPDQYLEIPAMSHGQHHRVLQAFLDSQWSENQEARCHARDVYYPRKSIGFWLKYVGDQVAIDRYFEFKATEELRLAEEYLRDNGVLDLTWK